MKDQIKFIKQDIKAATASLDYSVEFKGTLEEKTELQRARMMLDRASARIALALEKGKK